MLSRSARLAVTNSDIEVSLIIVVFYYNCCALKQHNFRIANMRFNAGLLAPLL